MKTVKTPPLLNLDANAKTVKGRKKGVATAILYLSPAELSGKNLCPYSTPGCRAACLNTAGHGAFQNVQAARLRKTREFIEDRDTFMNRLVDEIYKFATKAEKGGMTPVVRLNGTTDILWERIPVAGCRNIMEVFSNIQFYDYTKIPPRYRKDRPDNYHLTFSLAEDNDAEALDALEHGVNVAAVFKELPQVWNGWRVVNGDEDDTRFMDDEAVIVGLKAKGKARRDTSGFVR